MTESFRVGHGFSAAEVSCKKTLSKADENPTRSKLHESAVKVERGSRAAADGQLKPWNNNNTIYLAHCRLSIYNRQPDMSSPTQVALLRAQKLTLSACYLPVSRFGMILMSWHSNRRSFRDRTYLFYGHEAALCPTRLSVFSA